MDTNNISNKVDVILSEVFSLKKTLKELNVSFLQSNKEFIDEEELKTELGISRNTVYRLEKSGKITAYRFNGKGSKKYFKRKEIYSLLEEGAEKK